MSLKDVFRGHVWRGCFKPSISKTMLVWLFILKKQGPVHHAYKFTVKCTYISGIEEVLCLKREVSVRKRIIRKSFKWHNENIKIPLTKEKFLQEIARKWKKVQKKKVMHVIVLRKENSQYCLSFETKVMVSHLFELTILSN